jgi:hypothetical protein
MYRLIGIVIGVLGLSLAAQAEIYRTVDANGNVTFSDSPSKNSQRVQLPPLAIIPSMSPEEIARANGTKDKEVPASRPASYKLSFVSPVPNQTFQKPADTIDVAVALEPDLAAGDRLILSMNGNSLGDGQSTALATESLDRGAQTITARVVASTGKIMGEQSVTVFVQQPSKLMQNQAAPKR